MVKKDKIIFLILILLVIAILSASIFFYLRNKFPSNYANTVKIYGQKTNVQNLTMKVGEVRNLTIRGDGKVRIYYMLEPKEQKIFEVRDGEKRWDAENAYFLYFRKTFQIRAVSKGTGQITLNRFVIRRKGETDEEMRTEEKTSMRILNINVI